MASQTFPRNSSTAARLHPNGDFISGTEGAPDQRRFKIDPDPFDVRFVEANMRANDKAISRPFFDEEKADAKPPSQSEFYFLLVLSWACIGAFSVITTFVP
ncbi:hypothetical protein [Bosea sp. PAMC 26642]|uniref:hypothetical protein n=1 Tax=Bosea sp. (strain PAMC 26642) TaxID=1792307 RepID=UPI0012E7A6ED|nr:hypothetical protein [Bosea sp. PAMC 26642]